ncbi:MAG: MMPL family transporter [Desulfofustis sp.]|nr:MMPL family transporter [Desulfofustis sp.]
MIRYRLLLLSLVATIVIGVAGFMRLDVETDIVRSLPAGEKLLADAADIFQHHPLHDQVAIDLALAEDNRDLLVACAEFLKAELERSGLFSSVGFSAYGRQLQALEAHAGRHLPLLFSAADLQEDIAPRLRPDRIDERFRQIRDQLATLEGIGRHELLGIDPLGFRESVLARLSLLAPTQQVNLYRGHLLSADGRHLLLTATPRSAGTDTAAAAVLAAVLEQSGQAVATHFNLDDEQLQITPVGAFRAALDNELIIRHDVRLALLLATAGIAVLLLFSFPRPLIGLAALLPACAGSAAALFCYSLLHPTISVMVLGFGGALISITVDHGIAFFLFLDRSRATSGREAAREAFSLGLLAVITSVGAFVILSLTPFPIFTQLGQFTALGILFSFLFVHWCLPRIFVSLPPGSARPLPLQLLLGRLRNRNRTIALTVLAVAGAALLLVKPEFHVDLSSMNTVRAETRAADASFASTWGDGSERLLLMHDAATITGIQQHSDRLLEQLEEATRRGELSDFFVSSVIFPGPERQSRNLAAWRSFWSMERIDELQTQVQDAAARYGFHPDGFTGFFATLAPPADPAMAPPATELYPVLGITSDPSGTSLYHHGTALAGSDYDAGRFRDRLDESVTFFDSRFFSDRLADVLFSTFVTMLAVVAGSVVLLLVVFYLDLMLAALTLLPVCFAYVCTLATLRLLGHPFDIPALMLAVVVFGMGVDYAIFLVRAHQRYQAFDTPATTLASSAIFLAAASTLIGFGSLWFAEHSLLRSIGITCSLGLAYALLGTYLLLPPLLDWYFERLQRRRAEPSPDPAIRVLDRYRPLEVYPRMFARMKLRFDPLFTDLEQMLGYRQTVEVIVDVGCGHGVPACWCLERYPRAVVHGVEPDPEKARVAARAVGERGVIHCTSAPPLPAIPRQADALLLLDMLHYLDDHRLLVLLEEGRRRLTPGGIVVTRFISRPPRVSWLWHLEDRRVRLAGYSPCYRDAASMDRLFAEAGLRVVHLRCSAANPELIWAVGRCPEVEETTEFSMMAAQTKGQHR